MRPHFSFLHLQALALVFGTALAAQAPAEAGAAVVYRATAPSVFLLEMRGGTGAAVGIGSAFLIEGDRLVTNAHVASGGTPYLRTGAVSLPLTVERLGLDDDLAVLCSATPLNAQPLPLADTAPAIGTTIYVLGNPRGLERTISTGVVSGYRRFQDRDLMQITAAVSPGSSGGPVVDDRGRVVGVIVGYVERGQNLNFAIPIARLVALLEHADTAAVAKVPMRQAAEVVTEFLHAASRWNLTRMAELWGTGAEGPAVRYMKPAQLLDRLVVAATYLGHDSLRVLSEQITGDGTRLSVPVRLMRGSASDTVPLTLEQWREGGLLISDLHLEAVGHAYRAPSAGPRPAATPKASLTSSYRVALVTQGASAPAARYDFGALHLGERVGMLRLPWGVAAGEGDPAVVLFVSSARTNTRGQVALDVGGTVFDGFQTDSGVYLEGSFKRAGEVAQTSLVGFRYTPPLSADEGLYRAETRTDYYPSRGGRPSGQVTNWRGELAVVVARDSLWLDLDLVNEVGGGAGLRGGGRLTDSQFDVASPDGETRLRGRLRNGSIIAEWIDRRNGARFQGTLVAERF